jgi:excinuclease ABC subunit A
MRRIEEDISKDVLVQKEDNLEVYGARVHNLRDIDVIIPRNELVVITGLSGSGKSSLAFDTIYAEGQRRYLETFSAYARQFIGI